MRRLVRRFLGWLGLWPYALDLRVAPQLWVCQACAKEAPSREAFTESCCWYWSVEIDPSTVVRTETGLIKSGKVMRR